MNELDKARAIEATGDVRDRAVAHCREQIVQWGLAIPDTQLLVLDFGLKHFESVGLVESWITNEVAAGYCGKYLFVSDGQTCPMHHHKHKHETFFIVEGCARVIHDGETMELKKGDRRAIAALTKHSFTGIGPTLLLELSQPCLIDDNYFENTNIPIGGNYHGDKRC